jgi:hypothetical protein
MRFEQPVAGAEELLPPAFLARLASLLAAARRRLTLALTTDGVERLVRAADEVERVADDLRLRQLLAYGLPVGVVGIDRDRPDRLTLRRGQRAQIALHDAPAAPFEHLDDATVVRVGNDRRQLVAAPVVSLIEGEPPRRPSLGVRDQLDPGAEREGAPDLVAGRLLGTRDLGVGGTLARASKQAPPEPPRYPLSRRQLLMPLRERAAADATAKAALAPDKEGAPPGDRQVAHPHQRPLLHLAALPPTARAATAGRDELDLEVELLAPLSHRLHNETVQTEQSAKFLQHPLFLLAPRSTTTQSVVRAADVLFLRPLSPLDQRDPTFRLRLTPVQLARSAT